MVKTAMPALVEQADKNRAAKQGTGFTEEQVRRAVAASVHRPGAQEVRIRGEYWSVKMFAEDVIKRLREPATEPAEGGVYKSPAGVLYRRHGWAWERFGTNRVLTDDQLNYPVSEMERVL